MIDSSSFKTACFLAVLVLCVHNSTWAGTMDHHDIDKHPKCDYCGMDRLKSAHARVVVLYNDRTEEGYCSLHCASLSMAYKMRKAPLDVKVADYSTLELIPAHTATWVVGGKKRGVMTHKAKWAFKTLEDARGFVSRHEGTLVDYTVALQTAFADLYADMQMFWHAKYRQLFNRMNH